MPQKNEPPNLIAIALLIFAGWVIYASVGPQRLPDVPDDTKPVPVNPVDPAKPTEAQVWSGFADYVATNPFGVLNSHTNHVLLVAEELKRVGLLKDISRLDGWRNNRQEITDANRAQIVSVIRGK